MPKTEIPTETHMDSPKGLKRVVLDTTSSGCIDIRLNSNLLIQAM